VFEIFIMRYNSFKNMYSHLDVTTLGMS